MDSRYLIAAFSKNKFTFTCKRAYTYGVRRAEIKKGETLIVLVL